MFLYHQQWSRGIVKWSFITYACGKIHAESLTLAEFDQIRKYRQSWNYASPQGPLEVFVVQLNLHTPITTLHCKHIPRNTNCDKMKTDDVILCMEGDFFPTGFQRMASLYGDYCWPDYIWCWWNLQHCRLGTCLFISWVLKKSVGGIRVIPTLYVT